MLGSRLCGFAVLAGLVHPHLIVLGQQPDSKEIGAVSIFVTDTFGAPLPTARIGIRRLHEGKEFPVEFRGAVPFGTYRISALLSGYTAATKIVEVDQPVKWVTLALALAEIEGPSSRDIRGRIEPLIQASPPIWVKLVGVYSDVVHEAPVNEKGRFVIEGVLPGDYLAIVLAPGRVLKTQPLALKFRDNAELVTKLSR
jgi:hypothetical protein